MGFRPAPLARICFFSSLKDFAVMLASLNYFTSAAMVLRCIPDVAPISCIPSLTSEIVSDAGNFLLGFHQAMIGLVQCARTSSLSS